MENSITNPFVVITKDDFEAMVNQMATAKMQQPSLASKDNIEDAVIKPKTEIDDECYLSRKETADLLKVDFSTLWRWNKSGLLRSKKVGPRRVLYNYKDVLDFIETKTV